jgi:hypothetical protein
MRRSATRAARSVWMARLGRLGLGARGVLYILLAYLAAKVAFGHPNGQTDKQGALQTVARQPSGHILLAGLAVGFAGYALWKLAIAATGGAACAGSDKTSKRVIALISGLSYGFFCVSTVALAVGSSGSASADQSPVGLTGRVMRHSFGRSIVGLVGAGVIITGAVLAWRALSGKREVKLRLVSGAVRRRIDAVAKVGSTARALIIAAAGVFVLRAALAFDPNKAKGLDGILKSFAHTPIGPWLLLLVAGGVLAFGIYSLAAAKYAEM